jgi:outer membrane receptor protein involved in Fe transport
LDVGLRLSVAVDVVVSGSGGPVTLTEAAAAGSLVGVAQTASEGVVAASQIDGRPLQRAGDVLEAIPGVAISQHSGEGKANQYYLRGFNLDHGTDLASWVDGVPVNMPTHAHGQGYADLSFLLPELLRSVEYIKGPYRAEVGDFSSAGAVFAEYASVVERPLAKLEIGPQGYARSVAMASPHWAGGHLLGAVELFHNDGPWTRPDDYQRFNAVLRFSRRERHRHWRITGMAYRGSWNATDQVPLRALDDGRLGRFDAVDPSDGGDSFRASLAFDLEHTGNSSRSRIGAYLLRYELDLFSNFTYALDDPVHGDQFEQQDRRWVAGGRASHAWRADVGAVGLELLAGVDFRHDAIGTIGPRCVRRSDPGGVGSGAVGRSQLPEHVTMALEPAAAPLGAADSDRRRQRDRRELDRGQRTDQPRARPPVAADLRSAQPARLGRQRHRLLLPLALAWRGSGGNRGSAPASAGAARPAAGVGGPVLTPAPARPMRRAAAAP